MGRIFRFLFGSRTRVIVTLSGVTVLLVLGHFRPDMIHGAAFWVADCIATALSRLLGAIFGGVGDAARQHSSFFKSLFQMILIALAIIWMVRGGLRSILGIGKRKK
jgi:hypothetical protein